MSKKREDGLYRRKDSPFYWASYTNTSGIRTRCSTGTANRQEAEAILAKWRLETHRERHWGDEPERTFDELMLRYLQETQGSKRSAERDLAITVHLKGFFGERVLNTLGAKDVNGYIAWRREARSREEAAIQKREAAVQLESQNTTVQKKGRKKKPPIKDSTIRRELGLLSSAINHARKHWEWDIPNPVKDRKPPRGEDRIRWLKPEEAERLIAAARREPRAPHLVDFIVLGLHTGCRSQEMLGLEWDRVDLDQRLLYFPVGKNKSKRHVSVPLNEIAVQVLLRRKKFREVHCPSSPWVFCNKEGDRVASVKTSFRTACDRAGITDFRPHDLRHTCAAWLVQAGVPLMQIRDLLRHTSYSVTEKYAHLSAQHVRGAVDALNQKHADWPVTVGQAPGNLAASTDTSRFGHVRPRLRVITGGKR